MQPPLNNVHITKVSKPAFRSLCVCVEGSFEMGKEMKTRQIQCKKF